MAAFIFRYQLGNSGATVAELSPRASRFYQRNTDMKLSCATASQKPSMPNFVA